VQAGVAVGLAVGFVALANSAAVADQVRDSEWWLQALHVTQAWESSHGSGVTVAVLDTGVDASQPDLSGSVTTGPDFTNSGRTAGKPFWGIHGTGVASLIAGHGHGPNHSEGIIGIAPAAKILSVRVTLESNDPLLSSATTAAGLPNSIARGITYAIRHGADVIDLPLDPVTKPGAAGSGGGLAERRAIRRALARHVVLVAPAGDNGAGTDAANYPAAYRGVISVGAFDSHFVKAPFTSQQQYVTLTAAGSGVMAANPAHGYKAINSTSAASAMVAGAAALIKSQFPAMTPAQVTRALTRSTAFRPKGGHSSGSGYGTLDAGAALMTAAKIAEAVPKSANSAGGSPPSAPAVHPAAVSRNLGRTLAIDAGFAVVVFLVLLGVILAIRSGQRRRARSARLAEVRAAAQVQPPASPPLAASNQAGFMTAPAAAPAIPGMPAAGSVSGSGSLPGAVAARISSAAAQSTPPARGKRSGQNPDRPAPLPLRHSPAGHEAPAGAAPPAATPGATAPPPTAAQPAASAAADESAAPYGVTSAGLPRRVQPAAAAFPKSAFPRSGPEGSLFASGGTAPGGPPSSEPPSSAPAPAAAPGGVTPDRAFPASAFRSSAFADAPPVTGSPAQPRPAPGGVAGPASEPPVVSHRMDTVHRPPVSGSPPWEPAQQPDSELPWNQAPAPADSAAPLLPQRTPGYGDSVASWDAIAEEVWPGGPREAVPHPPAPSAEPEPRAPRGQRGASGWGSAPGPAGEPQQRERPIHVWNPEAGGSGPQAKPVSTSSAPPWETSTPAAQAEGSAHRNAPPWDDLGGTAPEPADGDSFAGFGPGDSGAWRTAAAAGGTAHPSPAGPPAEYSDPSPPQEESGFGSAYLPAAPRLPAPPAAATGLPGVPGGTNGSYPPPTPGGTANSYLWSAKSDPMGSSFPAEPGEGARSFDPAPAGESTETFGAVAPETGKGLWRLSLPTESTETFPAVPRHDSDNRQEDA
jgi:hypothetical protein